MFGKKRDPEALPCASCGRSRPDRPDEEVKTLNCFACGYPLPATLDARLQPDERATVAEIDRRLALHEQREKVMSREAAGGYRLALEELRRVLLRPQR